MLGRAFIANVIEATRPKTLTAAVVPVLCTAFFVRLKLGPVFSWSLVFFTLCSALAIQVLTNLINDIYDARSGVDNDDRLGPIRPLQRGALTLRQMKMLSVLCVVIAVMTGIPLILEGGVAILLIGLAALFLAYAYTGGIYPLAYRGVADIFVLLFFGIIACFGTSLILTDEFLVFPLVLGAQLGLLAINLLAVNNLRDIDGDRAKGKLTLAVRFGESAVRAECLAATLLAFFLFGLYPREYLLLSLTAFCILPLAFRFLKALYEEEPDFHAMLGEAARLHVSFGLAFSMCALALLFLR